MELFQVMSVPESKTIGKYCDRCDSTWYKLDALPVIEPTASKDDLGSK